MLEGLDDINWESLGYPQIPELVRQLASNDKEISNHASYVLERKVILGGVDYEDFDRGYGVADVFKNDAVLLLFPFLLELLETDSVTYKDDILSLMCAMTQYKDLKDQGEIYKLRIEKIINAIWDARHIIAKMLSNKDIDVRFSVLVILLEFNKSFSQTVETYKFIAQYFEPKLPSSE